MATFYIIVSINNGYVAAGGKLTITRSLNNAKHFTSIWSAEHFMKRTGFRYPIGYFRIKKLIIP